MSKHLRPRKGFTLAEVLVTVAIIAVLAAVLLPVVSNQLRKGDIGRVAADLVSLRTGVEAFLSDVRRVPGEVSHLISAPIADSSAASADINGDPYPAGLVSRWGGPYIDKEQDASGDIATGFGGLVNDSITAVAGPGGVDWATAWVSGLTAEELLDIDLQIDTDTSSTAGRLRWSGAPVIATYFLIPIN